MLNKKDQRVLSFVREYVRSNGSAPTLLEIKDQLDFKWLTSVQRSVNKLEKLEFFSKEKNVARGIRLEDSEAGDVRDIPLVGNIPCGGPLLAIENIDGYIPTDKKMINKDPGEYFYLRAQGDSMDLAGIKDGDLLLIHRQQTADDGERVVALIGDEATVKILKKGTDFAVLKPSSSNPKHRPIVLKDSLIVQGVVDKVLSL